MPRAFSIAAPNVGIAGMNVALVGGVHIGMPGDHVEGVCVNVLPSV